MRELRDAEAWGVTEPAEEERGIGAWVGVYLRGMAMGVAELIPGVSGGTIAFITGIYVELVRSIRGIGPRLAHLALQGRVPEAWREGNLGFLAVLCVGMASSLFLLANGVAWLLEHREVHIWAFFFGLILASVIYVGRFAGPWNLPRAASALLGVGAGFLLSNIQPLPAPEHWVSTMMAGAIAICAWILPGISGSFLLLLLGQYQELVRALAELDFVFLGALAAGMAGGLLLFIRFLMWLLRTHYRGTLAFLCGLMAGSLQKLWPWREAVTSYVDRHGTTVPLVERPISPGEWATLTGADPAILGALLSMVFAVVVVLGLELLSRRRGVDHSGSGFEEPERGDGSKRDASD